jgi:hypothetical protein
MFRLGRILNALVLTTLLCVGGCLLPLGVWAEPMDLKQADQSGSGFGFRRGETCSVVTARHVVKEDGVDVSVADRSGGRVTAQRAYDNEAYDLALVTLPTNSTLACTSRWPDSGWLREARFDTRSVFEAIRHYAEGGREVIIRLAYAGGSLNTLTLAPVDKVNVRASDSGSIVFFEGKPAGIIQKVDPETGRVEVLRFDVIDQLVGSRFRSVDAKRKVALDGVYRGNQRVPNWTVYLRSWLEEGGHGSIVDVNDKEARCRIRGDVLALQQVQEPNPEYGSLQDQLKTCGVIKALAKLMCDSVRERLSKTPTHVSGYKVSVDVAVTAQSGQRRTKLRESKHLARGNIVDRERAERVVLQKAFGDTITTMFREGACD